MGADYKKQPYYILSLGNYDVMAQNLTRYYGQTGVLFAAELAAAFVIPWGTIFSRMNVQLDAAPGGADTVQITVMRNGVATALNVILTGAVITGGIVNAQTFANGQRMSIRLITSATAANLRASVSLHAQSL